MSICASPASHCCRILLTSFQYSCLILLTVFRLIASAVLLQALTSATSHEFGYALNFSTFVSVAVVMHGYASFKPLPSVIRTIFIRLSFHSLLCHENSCHIGLFHCFFFDINSGKKIYGTPGCEAHSEVAYLAACLILN